MREMHMTDATYVYLQIHYCYLCQCIYIREDGMEESEKISHWESDGVGCTERTRVNVLGGLVRACVQYNAA